MSETLRDIRLFVAAYEERSFTAAAMREHGTQSGVSQHVRKLEERFGARLFSRDKGRVTPTPAGDAYYSRCVEMLRLHAATSQCMSQFGKGGSGDVSVGLMPTMTRIILAPAMRRFIEAFPNVSVRLVEAFSPTLTQSVLSGELDFAIVPSIPGRPGLKSWPFLTTHETLVSRFAPDRHLRPVRMGALGPLKLVLPGIANTRRRLIETYVASNGVAIERMLEMDSMMGTLDFVRGSDWCTVLPALMLDDAEVPAAFSVQPIVDPVQPLDLVVIEPSRNVISRAGQAFLEHLRVEAEQVNGRWAMRFAVEDAAARPAAG
ncbi:LysR family transcriptional regulator [Xanthobacter dioxanivorans]|uniref:LysR family transcriptional regulator n=1 Tax=Xanthobacter dioxanivorans TaxID=2528964 RepID=A0A974PLG3_9HYPH|nr:LysR family transcriptional regulator [Xanthobacter dioxanivorans]QRG05356.1 LysR family transcriptional regulator [Xanthobacter dioxanivorans]